MVMLNEYKTKERQKELQQLQRKE